jgi:DNA-binding winged helix-turn-helix (wHTH) protein
MDQSMTLSRVLAPALQIGVSDAATSTTQSTEGSLLAMSAYKAFGPFRLFPARQLLLEDAAPVRLGTRGLEILAALVERPGELVGKDELMARVWPTTVVEESNLKVHVAALRRALGEGRCGRRYIATVVGRGYRFVAPVERFEPRTALARQSAPAQWLADYGAMIDNVLSALNWAFPAGADVSNRVRLTVAAISIVDAFVSAGRKSQVCRPLGRHGRNPRCPFAKGPLLWHRAIL